MRSVYRFLAILLTAITSLSIEPPLALAQSHPPASKRQEIATALNTALGVNGTSVTVANVELFDAVTGTCSMVASLQLEIAYYPGYFILRRKLRNGVALAVPTAHPLVADLNGWLNAMWGMDLTNVPEFQALGWACSNPGQRYYTKVTSDADAINYIKEVSGENRLRDRYYSMAGVPRKGSDFIFFDKTLPRRATYITDLGDGLTQDSMRLLAFGFIRIECPGDMASDLTFEFDFETEGYTNDCGMTREQPVNVIIYHVNSQGYDDCRFLFPTDTSSDDRNRRLFDSVLAYRNRWHRSTSGALTDSLGAFEISADGYLQFVMHHSVQCGADTIKLCRLADSASPDEYCEAAYCSGGTFGLDNRGRLVYTLPVGSPCAECTSMPVPCIEFCDSATVTPATITQVVKADARTFSDKHALVPEEYFPPIGDWITPNSFEKGERGKWRAEREYAYRTATKPGSGLFAGNPTQASERNYNDAGVFDLQLFSWHDPNNSTLWLSPARATRYSQNGESVEEIDIYGIPSAARFGYGQQLPVLVVKNGTYGPSFFQSFETDVADESPTGGTVDDEVAHAGHMSYKVPQNAWSDPFELHYEVDTKARDEGVLIRVWTKNTYPAPANLYDKVCPIAFQFDGTATDYQLLNTQFSFVAKTGEWSLYEAQISGMNPGIYTLRAKGVLSVTSTWIDDLRIQQANSEMVCHVYEVGTQRQIAMFDDQHFGIYYQYDGEGKLIRKIRETMRGVKAFEETHYHTPLIARNYASSNVSRAELEEGNGVGNFSRTILDDGKRRSEGFGRDGKFDLLDIELGPEQRSMKVFGVPPEQLGEKVEKLKELFELPALERLEIPGIEKLQMVEELMAADSTLEALADLDEDDLNEAERAAHTKALEEATARRAEILGRLGVDEAQARELIEAARDLKEEIEEAAADAEEEKSEETKEGASDAPAEESQE